MARQRLGWIADGFRLSDYGEVGFRADGATVSKEEDGCALISCLHPPSRLMTDELYAVLLAPGALPTADHVRWDLAPVDPVPSDNLDTQTNGRFWLHWRATWPGLLFVHADVQDANGTSLAKLRLLQFVGREVGSLELAIRGLGSTQPLGADPDMVCFLLQKILAQVDEAMESATPKVARDLLVAWLALDLNEGWKVDRRSFEAASMDLDQILLNKSLTCPPQLILDFGAPGGQALPGLFWMDPVTAAMLTGKDGIAGKPYLDWIESKDFGKQGIRFDELTASDPAVGPAILNLLRFPRTNVRLALRLLSTIVTKYFDGLTVEKLKADPMLLQRVAAKIFVYKHAAVGLRGNIGRPLGAVLRSPAFRLLTRVHDEARTVHAVLGALKPTETIVVFDPVTSSKMGGLLPPYEQYGWRPGGHVGQVLENVPAGGIEVVLMDVGYWGHFSGDPQRNFGVVDGQYVYLCDLVPDAPAGVAAGWAATLRTEKVKLLAAALGELGYAFRVQSFAQARCAEDAKDRFFIVLPDLHLPTVWPDPLGANDFVEGQVSEPSVPFAGAAARKALRGVLRFAQSSPPDSATRNALGVQTYLQHLEAAKKERKWQPFLLYAQDGSVQFSFNAAQFEAERRSVDRELRLRSSWFYPAAPNVAFADLAWFPTTRGCPPEPMEPDPAPALDLGALLLAARSLRDPSGGVPTGVQFVVQVGDLFELWVNQEWLYLPFKKHGDDAAFSGIGSYLATKLAELPTKWHGVVFLVTEFLSNYQYRFSAGWKTVIGPKVGGFEDDSVPMYVFHDWPATDLVGRRQTGFLGAPDPKGQPEAVSLTRAKRLLRERVEDVYRFSAPKLKAPAGTAREKAFQALRAASFLWTETEQATATSSAAPDDHERYLWNRMLLELLADIRCVPVYGNHDGYRGDPALNTVLEKATLADAKSGVPTVPEVDLAKGWHFQKGVWFEHGHRWDPFNMDGVVLGAGITNLVHYYYRPILAAADSVKSGLMDQFREQAIPSVAQWHLLLEYGAASLSTWFPGLPPGKMDVCVMGHTHTPDLLHLHVSMAGK